MDYLDKKENKEEIPYDFQLTMLDLLACYFGMITPIIAVIPLSIAIGFCFTKKVNRMQKIVTGVSTLFILIVLIVWVVDLIKASLNPITSQI